MRIGAFAFAEHMKLFLSLAQNRGFCANERRQRSAVAGRVLRGLLKAESAGASTDTKTQHIVLGGGADNKLKY